MTVPLFWMGVGELVQPGGVGTVLDCCPGDRFPFIPSVSSGNRV